MGHKASKLHHDKVLDIQKNTCCKCSLAVMRMDADFATPVDKKEIAIW